MADENRPTKRVCRRGIRTPPQQVRIMLWAVPRSTSTAFLRAMMNHSSTKVFLEPFSKAYYFGEDKISGRYEDKPYEESSSFEDIKADLEKPFSDHKIVFVKDMAYYVARRLKGCNKITDILPNNYVHTFLLRHPQKTVRSLHKMSLEKSLTGWNHFDKTEVGFSELFKVYQMVTSELQQDAIIVDADDLLRDPESILKQYCHKVGITFEASMLNWKSLSEADSKIFEDWLPWFQGAIKSTCFVQKAIDPIKKERKIETYPQHIQKVINENMVYYNKMYPLRVQLVKRCDGQKKVTVTASNY